MILRAAVVMAIAIGCIITIMNAMPVGEDADIAYRVNKQTYSKAIDYALDKLVFESAEKYEGKVNIKTGCYRLWWFLWNTSDSSNKENFDSVKLDFIADENSCNPKNFSEEHKAKFWEINTHNSGLSRFIDNNGQFEASANDGLLMLTKEQFKKWFSDSNPGWEDWDVTVYTATLYHVGDVGSWEYQKVYEFVWGRNW